MLAKSDPLKLIESCVHILSQNATPDEIEVQVRCAIYLKNQLVLKQITNRSVCLTLLSVLCTEQVLGKPRMVSEHISICIGKIMSKHMEADEIKTAIEQFVTGIFAKNPTLIFAQHLKIIIRQIGRAKLGPAIEKTTFCTDFVNPIEDKKLHSKLIQSVITVFEYLAEGTKI